MAVATLPTHTLRLAMRTRSITGPQTRHDPT
jgi:hypothetical protein